MKIENVLFDLDGTLIDSSAGIEHSAREALAEVLPGVTLPALRPFIGPPVRTVFRLALRHVPGAADAATLALLEAAFRRGYDTTGWQLSTLYPGAISVVQGLTEIGIRCFVVTNKPKFSACSILDRLALSEHLAGTLCRDSRTPAFASKAAAVEQLVRDYQIRPQAAVFVGDSTDDADAARRNGMRFIAATYGYGLPEGVPEDAVASIDTLTLLTAAVQGLVGDLEASNPEECGICP